MRKTLLSVVAIFAVTILFSPAALAQNKPKAIIKLPTFVGGGSQIIDKPIDGDLMVAGNQVRITSKITGDVYVAGGQVDVSGTIGGNLIMVGGSVNLTGKVGKNIIAAGGQVKMDNTAEVDGYALLAGGTVDLWGRFMGPVKVAAQTMAVGEKAVILGNLEADVSKSEIAATSKISGEKKIVVHEMPKTNQTQMNQWRQLGYIKTGFSFLSRLLVLLVLVKLCGPKTKQVSSKSSLWSKLGLGMAVLIVTPIMAVILTMTIVAIPLVLIVLGVYLIELYLSGVVTSMWIGELISQKKYLKTNNRYLSGTIGLIVLTVIELIPFVGGWVKFVALILGLGIMFKKVKVHFS